MGFPLVHLFVVFACILICFLFLCFFFFNHDSFDDLLVLGIEDSLLLSVKLLSLLLEDLIANGLMLRNTIGIKLPSAPNSTHNKGRRVILYNFCLIFPVDLLETQLFMVILNRRTVTLGLLVQLLLP